MCGPYHGVVEGGGSTVAARVVAALVPFYNDRAVTAAGSVGHSGTGVFAHEATRLMCLPYDMNFRYKCFLHWVAVTRWTASSLKEIILFGHMSSHGTTLWSTTCCVQCTSQGAFSKQTKNILIVTIPASDTCTS